MQSPLRSLGLQACVAFVALAPGAVAQDLYLVRELQQLDFAGNTPEALKRELAGSRLPYRPHARVQMDVGLEAWVGVPFVEPFGDESLTLGEVTLGVLLPEGGTWTGPLTGHLYIPGLVEGEPGEHFTFTVDAATATPEARAGFLAARYLSATWLLTREAPGAALWRRMSDADREELMTLDALPVFDPNGRTMSRFGAHRGLDAAYGMFSGGRALSENLALDLVLEPEEGTEGWQSIGELGGIETPAIEWGEMLDQANPVVDALAHVVPAEQPFVHMPGLSELRALMAEAASEVPLLLELFESSSADAQLLARYERQLGVRLNDTVELFSKALVHSLVVTASDPFLRTGTDLALIFETDGSRVLHSYLRTQQEAARESVAEAEAIEATHHAVKYSGVRSPWREVSSYLVELPGGIVALSNSETQVHALIEAAGNVRPSIAELPEYRVYRDRYPVESGEAFVLISDDTIRRWASPHWRIAAARRTRASAVMADEAARRLLRESGSQGPRALRVRDTLRVPGGDRLIETSRGASSPIYGSPEFLTPVVELQIDKVTTGEAQAYESFRRTYENRWRDVFDPVGARVLCSDERMELDLSIRPLTRRSQYRSLIELVGNGELSAKSGVRGAGILGQLVYAMDTESRSFQDFQGMASSMAPQLTNPFAWIGDNLTVYVDDAPFWEEAAGQKDPMRWVEKHFLDMPIGVHIACKSPLHLAGFLSGLRAFVQETAPGLVRWESREHGDHTYLAIVPESDMGMPGLDLYYTTRPNALILGMTPGVIERALDRLAAGDEENAPELLGEHALGSVTEAGIALLGKAWVLENRGQFQLEAWDALPLWDELRRRFPSSEPEQVWARYFPSVPQLRGGDSLVWNAETGRHESQMFGTPVNPRADLEGSALLQRLRSMGGGLSFEDGDGLRARVTLRR